MTLDDPPRLREELARGSSALERELSQLAAKRPNDESLSRIAAALGIEGQLAAPETQPERAADPAVSSTSALGKVALGLGTVATVAALIWWSQRQHPELPNRPGDAGKAHSSEPQAGPVPLRATGPAAKPPSAVHPAPLASAPRGASEASLPGSAPSPTPLDNVAPAAQPAPAVPRAPNALPAEPDRTAPPAIDEQRSPLGASGAAGPTPPTPARESPAKPATERRATETELLRDARMVLDSSPQVALSLSEQHRRDYPKGSFVQERELIAITALVRLGRAGDAEARAARFRSAYPRSPYAARLDRLVPP